jgi:hypothetical protein
MVAPLRLVEFDLANAAWPAYIDQYIRVARIVLDTIDTSMRSLLHFAENDDTDVTHNIQELSIHSYAVSLVGDQDGIDDDNKVANNIIRIYTHLGHILPALRNCRRVSFSPEIPLAPDGVMTSFFGMNPMIQFLIDTLQDMVCIAQPMRHRLGRMLIWSVLHAVAQSNNAV